QLRHKAVDIEKTAVIFDGIQFCPQALTSLNYFYENMPRLNIMCAGSLLGIALAKPLSFPVGKVNFLTLYPMDFSEFLLACGQEYLYNYLKELPEDEKISPALFGEIKGYYRDYILVGGMPEAVLTWVNTHDTEKTDAVLSDILKSYELDFAKHAPSSDFPKLSAIWKSIPYQLAKENKKFVYSKVVKGGRSRNLSDALEWLVSAGLVYKINLIEKPYIPLSSPADISSFKVYLCDVGLLRLMSRFPIEEFFSDDVSFSFIRGAVTENFVLTELVSSTGDVPFYWSSGNTAEIEFVIQDGSNVVPIEVKAGIHTASKSLKVYRERFSPKYAVRFSLKNKGSVSDEFGKFISLPLFLSGDVVRQLK
ncbi:MAG: ATP-binding protein, partial [Methanocorpusculum sp.]|nr:ATP-binding protein [Methanocorpusculum sp.]